MKLPTQNGMIALFIALAALPFLLWFRNEGIPLSDESAYAHAAVQWMNTGLPTTGASIFEHRWALIYPMSILAGSFGKSIFGLTLWSTLCFMGVLASLFIWMRAKGHPNTFWAIALLATNPAMIWAAVNISPDMVCTFFALVASLLTLERAGRFALPKGLLAGVALCIAFLAKETVVFFGIPMLVFAVGDLLNRRNQRFWTGLLAGTTLFIAAYLSVYQIVTGNFLHRLDALQSDYLNRVDNPYSFVGKPWAVRLERLFIRPIPFFLKEPGYSFIGLALLLSLQNFLTKTTDTTLREIGIIAVCVGCYFVFGTVSLSSYTPITLADRMILPVLPYLVLLVVEPITSEHKMVQRSRILAIATLGLASICIAVFSQRYTFPLMLTAIFATVVLIAVWKQRLSQYMQFSLILGFQLAFLILTPRNMEYFNERDMLVHAMYDPQTQAIVTDPRMADLYRSHIAFDNAFSGKVVCWDSISSIAERLPHGVIYVLENKQRIASPVIGKGQMPDLLRFSPKTDQLVMEQGHSRLWKRFLPMSIE